jgi:hypothetical protein
LDRVIDVVRIVLNFINEDQLLAVCRRIEHICSFLTPSGNLTSADGNRTEIRQHMRVFLKYPPGATLNTDVTDVGGIAEPSFLDKLDPNRRFIVVVNMDEALQTYVYHANDFIINL